jgi:hypothetical protein
VRSKNAALFRYLDRAITGRARLPEVARILRMKLHTCEGARSAFPMK